MDICFIIRREELGTEAKWVICAIWGLICIPFVNIFVGLYHIYGTIFTKATRHDTEMLKLFSKYMIYISFYLICSLLLIIIYVCDSFLSVRSMKAYQYFIYVRPSIIYYIYLGSVIDNMRQFSHLLLYQILPTQSKSENIKKDTVKKENEGVRL